MLFLHRIGPHPDGGRDPLLPGNFSAASIRPEFEAVIHTAHIIAFLAPDRKRGKPVAAQILQHREIAIALAVGDERIIEQGERGEGIGGKIRRPADHIPAMAQILGKHGGLLLWLGVLMA